VARREGTVCLLARRVVARLAGGARSGSLHMQSNR
jgi:hypothetical protein